MTDLNGSSSGTTLTDARLTALALILGGFYITLLVPMRMAPDPELGQVAVIALLGLIAALVAPHGDPVLAPAAIATGSIAALALNLILQSVVGPTSAMEPGAWLSALRLVLVLPPVILAAVTVAVAVVTRRTYRASALGLASAIAITAGSVFALGAFAAGTNLTIHRDEQVLTIILRDDAILLDPPSVDAGYVTIVETDETTQPRSTELLGPIDDAELERLRAAVVPVPPDPVFGDHAGARRPVVCCRAPLMPGRNAWAAYGYTPDGQTRLLAAIGTVDVRLAPEGFATPREDRLHRERFALFGGALLVHGVGVLALAHRRRARAAVTAGAVLLPILWIWFMFELARNPF